MAIELHFDFETFSSVDITKCGSYKYFESPDFEILLLSYCIKNGRTGRKGSIKTVSFAEGEEFPDQFLDLLNDPEVEKHAHNANFERNCLKTVGIDIPASEWRCSAVKVGYCGLPMALGAVSKVLKLGDDGKISEGKNLIKYFSGPVKPTKANGMRRRNMWYHNPEKWAEYKRYNRGDVHTEMVLLEHPRVEPFKIPAFERLNYALDQKINDRGVKIDVDMAMNAVKIDKIFKADVIEQLKKITGLVNPNSPAQLQKWLSAKLAKNVENLTKDNVEALIKEHKRGIAVEVLKLRQRGSKTSTTKFMAMVKYALSNDIAYGLLYFYGAWRTGRWAGRAIQIHNLPRNKMKLLDFARNLVKKGDYQMLSVIFDNIPAVLSQLIRTTFIASPGNVLAVADYSAIEARITAWISGEKWRLEIFKAGDIDIYEASAAKMYNINIKDVDDEKRSKGKICELALGFGGSLGALITMGGDKWMTTDEMKLLVKKWRKTSPEIVKMWAEFEECAISAIENRKPVTSKLKGIVFNYEHKCLTILLPSGRKLVYQGAVLSTNRWGNPSVKYWGKHQKTGQWAKLETYGGKISENIIQAIARDLLAEGMRRLDAAGFDLVMHVHDEAVADIENLSVDFVLENMCRILGEPVKWAPGLNTPATGFITPYYKKD